MTLEEQLMRDEGCRLTCYLDSLGNWTVGVGHKCATHIGTITQTQADLLLASDLALAAKAVSDALTWAPRLDPVRLAALINMTFNMGIGHLLQFHHFLGYMQSGDWAAAARAMLESLWANEVYARAQRLAAQIVSGVMQ
jgi:lysozyme